MKYGKWILVFAVASCLCARAHAATPAPLSWSTYFGGSLSTQNWDIDVDGNGDVVVTGIAWEGFPTTAGAYDTSYNGEEDCFVAKFDGDTGDLLWSTYLGTFQYDEGQGIKGLPDGDVLVCGLTSGDLPMPASDHDTLSGASDIFVVRLSSDGTTLEAGMYVGGSAWESSWERNLMAIDSKGFIYLTGYTGSSNLATLGADDTTRGGTSDAFLAKLNPTLTGYGFVTYIGGSSGEIGKAVAVDANDHVCVTGMTQSADFPATPGAYDTTHGGEWDAFLVKVNEDGSDLDFATYLGGLERDYAIDVAIETTGEIVIAGKTHSPAFPATANAFDTTFNGIQDIMVARFSSNGAKLKKATFIGGTGGEICLGLDLDAEGNIWLSGETTSLDFPLSKNAYDRKPRGIEANSFVVALKPTFKKIFFASYLGSKGTDMEGHIVVGNDGNPIVSGNTNHAKFPVTPDAYQPDLVGAPCSFITKIEVVSTQ